MGELGNLALVLKFGMQLEDSISDFYEDLASDPRLSEHKELLQEFKKESESISEDLRERYLDCSRSDMDMGALEPVSGIVEENYEVEEMDVSSDQSPAELINKAVEVEEKSAQFYRDIGEKIDFLSLEEMKRLAEQKEERAAKLRDLNK